METLTNAGVLVTGAGRGIGKRLAIGFATAGNRVALLARSKAELDLAHLEIEHAGGNALRIRADVTDFEQVNAAVDRVVVETVLKYARGNQVQASELLGISRTTLRGKLRSLGLAIEKQLLPEPNLGD